MESQTMKQRFSIIFLLVLACSLQAAAAPLCSEVLKVASQNKITAIALEKTLEAVARLRMAADKEKSAGNIPNQRNLAESIYQKKYAELLSHLKDTKSNAEVKALLEQKISDLQGLSKVAEKKEKTERQAELAKLKFSYKDYEISEQIEVPFSMDGSVFEYVPQLHSLLLYSKENLNGATLVALQLFNLETKTTSQIYTFPSVRKFSGHGRFVVAGDEGSMIIFDLLDGTQRIFKPTNYTSNTELNPSGTRALFHGLDVTGTNRWNKVHEVTTGEKIEHEDLNQFRKGAVRFLSDDEVIYLDARSDGRKDVPKNFRGLARYHLKTGRQDFYFEDHYFESMEVSQDHQSIFLTEKVGTGIKIYETAIKDLGQLTSRLVELEQDLQNDSPNTLIENISIKPLPDSALAVSYDMGKDHFLKILAVKNSFSASFTNNPELKTGLPAIDTETHRIFTFEKTGDYKSTINVWTRFGAKQ
jgi:hypothetical protein